MITERTDEVAERSLQSEPRQAVVRSFRALAVILSYPDESWLGALTQITAGAASESLFSAASRAGIRRLGTYLESQSALVLQERYVNLFDRTRAASLHLFEHSHGDARERGQAMARLRELYAVEGWLLDARELPDYLPAICEFLALASLELRVALLKEAEPTLRQLAATLSRNESPYAAPVQCLVDAAVALAAGASNALGASGETSQSAASGVQLDLAPSVELNRKDFDALDREWEEAPVTFGPAAAHDSCAVPPPLVDASALVRSRRGPSSESQNQVSGQPRVDLEVTS